MNFHEHRGAGRKEDIPVTINYSWVPPLCHSFSVGFDSPECNFICLKPNNKIDALSFHTQSLQKSVQVTVHIALPLCAVISIYKKNLNWINNEWRMRPKTTDYNLFGVTEGVTKGTEFSSRYSRTETAELRGAQSLIDPSQTLCTRQRKYRHTWIWQHAVNLLAPLRKRGKSLLKCTQNMLKLLMVYYICFGFFINSWAFSTLSPLRMHHDGSFSGWVPHYNANHQTMIIATDCLLVLSLPNAESGIRLIILLL